MINNKKIIAIIPARGGSKGIKLKNLQKIGNDSLINLVGSIIAKSGFIDRSIISTDNDLIAKEAQRNGIDVPFIRPKKISGDLISDVDVLTHALIAVEKIDKTEYDIIVMLQPTSPFRKAIHVKQTVEKLIYFDFDSVLTVSPSESKSHPLKQLVLLNDNIDYYDKRGKKIIARQQLDKVYHRNGAVYSMTRECLLKQKTTIGNNASALILEDLMVNIDTPLDLEWANFLNKSKLSK